MIVVRDISQGDITFFCSCICICLDMNRSECLSCFLQALDSDGEETAREGPGGSKSKSDESASGEDKAPGSNIPAISEASSDGELVEIPDQESDTAQKKAVTVVTE